MVLIKVNLISSKKGVELHFVVDDEPNVHSVSSGK